MTARKDGHLKTTRKGIMENAIEKSYLPAVKEELLIKLEKTANDFQEICKKNDMSPITAIARAGAMQKLRTLLTDEIMKPVMELQGSPLGFKTDKDTMKDGYKRVKGPGYAIEIVRDTLIYALGKGAQMINNEINILASNPYLTKGFFQRKLNEVLGAENWKIIHSVPHIVKTADGKIGAIVKSKVWWRDSKTKTADGKTQELEFAIKGDEYASSDSYLGKADRKAGNWLLNNITGEPYEDGAADDAFDIEAKTIPLDRAPAKFAEKKEDAKAKTIADALAEIQAPVTEDDVKEYYKSREMTAYPELIIKDIHNVVNNVLEWLDGKKDGKLI
jgi:hypothetical protein